MKRFLQLFLTQRILLLLIIPFFSTFAQEIKLPPNLGQNNIGTEFYLTFHPAWETHNPSNAFVLYVSSQYKTLVHIEIPAEGYSATRSTIPNDIIEIRLPPGTIPYSKTDQQAPLADSVFLQQAIHVTSDDPIVVYGVCRYEYTSDSFLALPVFALGKRYIVASYNDPTTENFGSFQYLPSYTSIIGAYDDTEVRFTLGGNPTTKTAGGMKPGDVKTIKLNEGDVFLVASISKRGDLSGSIVEADKPVGVISGNYCTYIPSEFGACDYIIEMELPDYLWGKEFHVPKIETRKKNAILRIMPSKDNTIIYRDGSQIASIPKSGGIIGQGFIEVRRDDDSNSCNVYTGSEPISITAYNPGQQYDGVTSDPFQMVLTPVKQYQKELIFNTPGIRGGFGFPDNYATVIHETNGDGKIPKDLKFGKVVNGEMRWVQVRDSIPGLKTTLFKTNINNKQYIAFTITLPGDAVYSLSSTADFAAYIYGFSNYDSYGCPASAAVTDYTVLNDLKPPSVTWEIDKNGVINGKVDDDPKVENNSSKLSMVSFIKALSTNLTFESSSFVPGESVKSEWKLKRIDPSKDAKAVLFCSDKRGNDTTIVIEMKSGISIEDIEQNIICENSLLIDTIPFSNIGNKPIKFEFSKAYFQRGKQGFALVSPKQDIIIEPQSKKSIIVSYYKPVSESYYFSDTLMIPHDDVYTGTNPVKIGLTTFIIAFETDMDSLNFGKVYVGESKILSFNLINYFTVPLTINRISPYISPEDNSVILEDIDVNKKDSNYVINPGQTIKVAVKLTPTEIYKNHFHIMISYNHLGTQCLKDVECLAESSGGQDVHISIPHDTIGYKDISSVSIPLNGWIDDPIYKVDQLDLVGSLKFDSRLLSINELSNGTIISNSSINNETTLKFECKNITLSSEKTLITTFKGTANTDEISFTNLSWSSISVSPPSKVDTSIVYNGSLYVAPGTSIIEQKQYFYPEVSPNPANSIINVTFELPEASKVGISLTDLLGRQSNQLYDQFINKGVNNLSFDISDFPPGMYLLKISTSGKSEFLKIIKY